MSDNARYYRNIALTDWISGIKTEPIYLPAYSPNLNIIERLWKFMRKKIINTVFYRKKEGLRKAVLSFFENISRCKDESAALPTLNFHIRKLQNNS
ncbi:MAG: transposase [Bacteroidetes bacterium]|nr:transposase [Bacteroidota bacterium]